MKQILLELFDHRHESYIGSWKVQVFDVNRLPIRRLFIGDRERHSSLRMKLDLLFDSGQVYTILVEPDGCRSTWMTVSYSDFVGYRIKHETDTIVKNILTIPQNFNYNPKKLCELNIRTRMLSFGHYVHVIDTIDNRVDRMYYRVESEFKMKIKDTPLWASAPGHGKRFPDAWKGLHYPIGNLQYSFSTDGTEVDVDIDLEKGINHIGEVIGNRILRRKTDQLDVYSILFSQGTSVPPLTEDLA